MKRKIHKGALLYEIVNKWTPWNEGSHMYANEGTLHGCKRTHTTKDRIIWKESYRKRITNVQERILSNVRTQRKDFTKGKNQNVSGSRETLYVRTCEEKLTEIKLLIRTLNGTLIRMKGIATITLP
jgi:hypothetical protein